MIRNVDEEAPRHPCRWFLQLRFSEEQHDVGSELTSIHRSQHARDKLVYTPTLFDERDKRGDATFVIRRVSEM